MQGHNKDAVLKAHIERIQKLEEEKADIAANIADVYSQAKSEGFDTKVMKKAIALAKKPADEVQEEMVVLDLYLKAIGIII